MRHGLEPLIEMQCQDFSITPTKQKNGKIARSFIILDSDWLIQGSSLAFEYCIFQEHTHKHRITLHVNPRTYKRTLNIN